MASSFGAPKRITSLVVTDALGKRACLESSLKRAGLPDFHVLVLDGPLRAFSHSLHPLGIDQNFQPIGRGVVDEAVLKGLRAWGSKAQRVFLATDVGEQGDLLASDVGAALQGHQNISRVRVRNLHYDGIVSAFSRPEPMSGSAAWPAIGREILDRLVSYVMSRRLAQSGDYQATGCRDIALASHLAGQPAPATKLVISLRAADALGPYRAELLVNESERHSIERIRAFVDREHRSESRLSPGKTIEADPVEPWSYCDCLIEIPCMTTLSAGDVAASLRRLYLSGRLSFPGSGAREVGGRALEIISGVAERNGFKFDPSRVAQFVRGGIHDHEAPHPVIEKLDLTTPVGLLGHDDAVLSLLARQLIACGQPHLVQEPDTAALPEWATSLHFERRVSTWLSPIQVRQIATIVQEPDPARHLLSAIRAMPVSYNGAEMEGVERFVQAGMLDHAGGLSAKGMALVAAAPTIFRDTRSSGSFEEAVRALRGAGDFGAGLRKLLGHLGIAAEAMPALESAIVRGGGI